jgi:hypothetical protein
MPSATDSVAWKQLMDPQGFGTPYGPTTLEVRSPYYMQNAYTSGAYEELLPLGRAELAVRHGADPDRAG